MVLDSEKEHVVLRSGFFNFLSKLLRAANYVWFCLNPFCHQVHEVVYLTTKTIQIKPYNLQEVEKQVRSTTFSFFR